MSKLQTKIKIMQKDSEGKFKSKQYTSAEFLPGPVVEQAAEIMEEMYEADGGEETTSALKKAYGFIADTIFEGQFTGEEFRQGVDAREIASLTGKLLKSVTAGFNETYGDTKKK
ncbi:phage tail assembly chaperone G [Enterococcus sp. SMC-9]|uniref:phage tail assembly chaperone G n=1 Tax=Enterococcus sp. SMC-9 TaxID=2862343 RepID=UPI001E513C36|nr:hypothetical protein [Enterococcus sp. SMC-9]MCD1025707.1 hypothetical protein [Enterococcus sp. SMC-9]